MQPLFQSTTMSAEAITDMSQKRRLENISLAYQLQGKPNHNVYRLSFVTILIPDKLIACQIVQNNTKDQTNH